MTPNYWSTSQLNAVNMLLNLNIRSDRQLLLCKNVLYIRNDFAGQCSVL